MRTWLATGRPPRTETTGPRWPGSTGTTSARATVTVETHLRDNRNPTPFYSILFDPLMGPVKLLSYDFPFSRHREQTPPARHGGYPGPGHVSHVSPTRHSADRETRSPRSPGRYHQEAGMRTPGSRSRSRGHSRDRNSVHGGRSNRGYSRQGSIIG